MVLSVVTWIIVGALAGWLTNALVRPTDSREAIDDETVGIIGALIGGFFAKAVGNTSIASFDFTSLVAAIAGSILLLLIITSARRLRPINKS
jgi:uncharacterized membrane protein YeaQ/YmgE (transglycosylase-associated protein family)